MYWFYICLMRKLLFFLFILISLNGFCTRYYFNPNTTGLNPGNDAYTALQAQDSTTPWRTITKLNAWFKDSTLNPGDSLLLKRGTTFFTTTGIVISQSGLLATPIVIAAYGTGAKPVVCGMTDLTFTPVFGRPNIYISQAIAADSINQVTVNNVPVVMGRWPNLDNGTGGYNTIHTSTANSIVQTGDPGDPATSTTDNSQQTYQQPTIRLGAEIVYRADNFFIIRGIISAYTLPNVTFRKKWTGQANPVTSDNDKWGYFFQNDSNFLDRQNEWYFIRGAVKKLEIFSSTGTPTNVRATSCQYLVSNSVAVNYINILNIDFNGCDQDIIFFSTGTCKGINITGCTMQNAGRNGVNFDPCTFSTISNDSIKNSNANCVRIGDNADYCNVLSNYISGSNQLIGQGSGNTQDGRGCFSGDGVYIYHSGNAIKTIVQGNTIKNSGYAAVHFGRSDSTIVKYNYCDTALNVMDDGGIIYTYNGSYVPSGTDKTDTTKKGRIIIGNTVINGIGVKYGSGGTLAPGKGVSCIYNDKGSNNIIQDSNFCSVAEKGIFMNFGCINMKVRANTIYNCDNQLQINTRQEDTTKLNIITGNICYSATTSQRILSVTALDNASSGSYKPKPSMIGLFGTLNSNYYLRPLSTSPTLATIIRIDRKTSVFSDSLITYAQWRTYCTTTVGGGAVNFDINTILTPYTYASPSDQSTYTIVQPNPTSTGVLLTFTGMSYRDIYGNTYTNSALVPAYKSLIAFRIPDPPSNSIIKLRSIHLLPN